MKKTINILGESITIAFNMASLIGFEEITGKPFNEINIGMSKDTLALSLAVIIANNPDTQITANALMTQASGKEISELTQAVNDAFIEWNTIPETLSDDEDGQKRSLQNISADKATVLGDSVAEPSDEATVLGDSVAEPSDKATVLGDSVAEPHPDCEKNA